MVDLGPLNIDTPQLPQLDVSQFVPSFAGGKGGTQRAPLSPNTPGALSGYQTKYAAGSYVDQLALQYPDFAINALKQYDQQRVSKGQAPLSEEQTAKVLSTVVTGEPATPAPKRGLLNVPGNAIKNVSDIVRSIPRLPVALAKTAADLPLVNVLQGQSTVGEEWGQVTKDAHGNPLKMVENIANVPGINLFPGSFIASHVTDPKELARNPVFTFLDALPAGNKLAEGTKVGELTAQASAAIKSGDLAASTQDAARLGKMADRPLKTALLNKVADDGSIVRTGLGETVDQVAKTKVFRALDQSFGAATRDAMFSVGMAGQRVRGILGGDLHVEPDTYEAVARQMVENTPEIRAAAATLPGGMSEYYQRMETGNLSGLTDEQATGVELIRKFNAATANELAQSQRSVLYGGELYDAATGLKLRRAQAQATEAQRINALRNQIVGGTATPEDVLGDLLQMHNQRATNPRVGRVEGKGSVAQQLDEVDRVTNKRLALQHKGTMAALEAAGYDTTVLKEAWAARKETPNLYPDTIRQVLTGDLDLPASPKMSYDDIITELATEVRDPRIGGDVRQLLQSLQNGEWKTVSRKIDALFSKGDDLFNESMRDSLRHIRDQSKTLAEDFGKYTDKRVSTLTKQLSKTEAESVPARFVPLVSAKARQNVLDRLIPALDAEQAAAVIQSADTINLADIPGFNKAEYGKIVREAASTWKDMRDVEGLDPVFLHTVTPARARSIMNPVQSIVPVEPSSVRARTLDMTPAVQDVTVAMTHQAQEILSQKYVEIALKDIVDQMGKSERSLREQFSGAARRRAESNTALTYEGHLQQIISENFRKFDPDTEGYTWGSPYLKKLSSDQPYIPLSVYKNLKALADPKSLFGGLTDKVTGLFRMATTALSVRTQIYNIIGGAVAAELSQPGALIRSGRKAYRYMHDPESMPTALRELTGSQKHVLSDMDKEAFGVVNDGAYAYLKGKTLGRFWDDAQKAKVPGRGITGRFGGAIQGLAEKAYTINGVFDDFYRMTTYIDAFDSAIKKGETGKFAEAAAIGKVRGVLQDWLGMTPIERTVMKSVFPFYGFMGHAMRFVLRYPLDHPVRAEMISKLALAEMEDQGALPSRFLSYLFFGGSGANGERNALNLGPLNPFGDVANFMTIQGALGSTNPVFQTILQMAGVENGEASLYPSLRYDAETGRMGVKSANPISALLSNTIPQSQLLTAILGVNSEYNDMARRDPAAAARFIASSLTLPIPYRQFNVPQEQMKAELARQDSEKKVLQRALSSGDWSEAVQYPSLREYLDALDKVPQSSLAAFKPLTPGEVGKVSQADQSKYQGVTPLSEQVASQMASVGPTLPTVATTSNYTSAGIPKKNTTDAFIVAAQSGGI